MYEQWIDKQKGVRANKRDSESHLNSNRMAGMHDKYVVSMCEYGHRASLYYYIETHNIKIWVLI